jgi:hypothetical protein
MRTSIFLLKKLHEIWDEGPSRTRIAGNTRHEYSRIEEDPSFGSASQPH